MNKKKVLLAIAIVVALAAALTAVILNINKDAQQESWIYSEVFTPSMDSLRQDSSEQPLDKYSLVAQPIVEGDITLYNMIYYPTAHTIICTVTEPVAFGGKIAPYLVTSDNRGFSGWYMPSITRYGIMKIAFEELSPYGEFAYLDLVSQESFNGVYDPSSSNSTRIRIPLPVQKLVNADLTDSGQTSLSESSAA